MDSQTGWWLSADRTWRRGQPPGGWWQAANRRWYPPEDETPDHAISTQPRHIAARGDQQSPDDEPAWTRVSVPIALGVLVLIVAAIWIARRGSADSVGDQTDSSPAGEVSQQDDNAVTTATAAGATAGSTDPANTKDPPPTSPRVPAETTTAPSDRRFSAPSDTSTSMASDSSDPATREPAPSAHETTTDEGSDPCPPFLPPGQPTHPVGQDRADRACK